MRAHGLLRARKRMRGGWTELWGWVRDMDSIVGELAFMATSAGKAFVILMDPMRLMYLAAGCIMGLVLGIVPGIGGPRRHGDACCHSPSTWTPTHGVRAAPGSRLDNGDG